MLEVINILRLRKIRYWKTNLPQDEQQDCRVAYPGDAQQKLGSK